MIRAFTIEHRRKCLGKKLLICILITGSFFFESCSKEEPERENRTVLTWWSPDRSGKYAKTMSGLPVYKKLQEETCISLQFLHPSSGQHAEQFRVMLASGELPDIISHDFVNDYPGGVEKAIHDGIIIPINDLLEDNAPYFSAFLRDNPEVAAMIRTEEERYFCFPSLQLERDIRTYMGPFYRADIFEELHIKPPRTIAEWTEVLEKLKFSPDVDIPLSFYGGSIRQTNAFIGAFGIGWGFYHNDGTVVYGPMEDGFEMFISTLAGWYEKGYIDPGFAVNSLRLYQRQAVKKNIGILIDYVSSMDVYSRELAKKNPKGKFSPLPYPSRVAGGKAEFGHLAPSIVPFAGAYITSGCTNPETAVRMLDYAYSPEGEVLFNFGIEGESFTYKNGAPVFLPELAGKLKKYIIAGPYLKDPRQFTQSLYLPEQKKAVMLWADTHASIHELPPLYPSAKESGELDVIMRRIRSFEEEMVIRFVTGEEPVSSVGQFQRELRDMGIDRAVAIMQSCFDRKLE